MKPWKSRTPELISGDLLVLQWGHGDEAVEEANVSGGAITSFTASMGPRR